MIWLQIAAGVFTGLVAHDIWKNIWTRVHYWNIRRRGW